MYNKHMNKISQLILEFASILNEKNINWSISKKFYDALIAGQNIEKKYSVALYWKDFSYLAYLFPDKFKFVNNKSNKGYLASFKFNKQILPIQLIIGSTKEKIESIDKKNKSRLKYWDASKNSLLTLLKSAGTQPIHFKELIYLLCDTRPTLYLFTDATLDKFIFYNNLNWNKCKKIEFEGVFLPYFNDFELDSVNIKI